jgi:hypothetical protein
MTDRPWKTESMGTEADYLLKARLQEHQCSVDIEATLEDRYREPRSRVVAHGFLRFDGCINVSFDDPKECHDVMAHFCDAAGVKRFGEMLTKLYELGRKELVEAGTWHGKREEA